MANMIHGPVMFFEGTLADYNNLSAKVPNGIYFLTDEASGNRLIYQQDKLFPLPYLFVNSQEELPETGIKDVIYINPTDNLFSYWIDPEYDYDDITNDYHNKLSALEKDYTDGVYEEEQYLIEKEKINQEYQNLLPLTKGKYEVSFGQNIVHKNDFIDAFNRVSFDSQKRIINIPQWDANSSDIITLTINLGKDLILEEGSYYDKDLRAIRLKLVSPDNGDTGEQDSYIDIPVDDLIDIYAGTPELDVSKAITISVDQHTNEGDVDVRYIRAQAHEASAQPGEKPNALEVRNDGLYVDVESYTDTRIGDLGNDKENNPFLTVTEAIQQAQEYADQGIKDAAAAQSTADAAAPKSTVIALPQGESPLTLGDLSADRVLQVTDINGAAPINNAIFTGSTQREDNLDDLYYMTDDNVFTDSANEVATVRYVIDSHRYSNTWGGMIKFRTWESFLE